MRRHHRGEQETAPESGSLPVAVKQPLDVRGVELHRGLLRQGLSVAGGDEFGGDADGDFVGGDGADAQADRGADPGEGFGGDAFAQKSVEDGQDLPA